MPDQDPPSSERYSLPASVVGIVVTIALAGIANVYMLASWKGAMDSRMASIEAAVVTTNQRLERTDALAARVSVLEARMEQAVQESQRTRSAVEDMRVEILRAGGNRSPR